MGSHKMQNFDRIIPNPSECKKLIEKLQNDELSE